MRSTRGNAKNAYYGSRPKPHRELLPVLIVVCDDRATAVNYFNAVKSRVKEHVTLHVERSPKHNAPPKELATLAMKHKTRHRASHKRDGTFVLLDTEADLARERLARMIQQEFASDVRMLLSHPCFEVWTLAHLADTWGTFDNCGRVLTEVKREWKRHFGQEFPQKKAQADYTKLMELREKAATRSRQRRSGTFTEVHELSDRIDASKPAPRNGVD